MLENMTPAWMAGYGQPGCDGDTVGDRSLQNGFARRRKGAGRRIAGGKLTHRIDYGRFEGWSLLCASASLRETKPTTSPTEELTAPGALRYAFALMSTPAAP